MQETCGLGAKFTENKQGLPCKVPSAEPGDDFWLWIAHEESKRQKPGIIDQWNFIGLAN
tara:strand:+ start:19107 stop:19283 length:177 start_codon:yes stop_codon:yes gene_type:complete